jgi:hypothetical protein
MTSIDGVHIPVHDTFRLEHDLGGLNVNWNALTTAAKDAHTAMYKPSALRIPSACQEGKKEEEKAVWIGAERSHSSLARRYICR